MKKIISPLNNCKQYLYPLLRAWLTGFTAVFSIARQQGLLLLNSYYYSPPNNYILILRNAGEGAIPRTFIAFICVNMFPERLSWWFFDKNKYTQGVISTSLRTTSSSDNFQNTLKISD